MAKSATARVTQPTQDQSATIAALEKQLADANAKLARNNPVAPRSLVDTGDLPVGQGGDVRMAPTGEAELEHPTVEPVDRVMPKALLDALAFNEEFVTVLVHESTSEYAEPCVSVWNDGRHQLFPRGVEITVRRKFVEVLARSKPIRYGNIEFVNEQGIKEVKWPKRAAHGYPFTVVRDDNPRGRAWLAAILAEA